MTEITAMNGSSMERARSIAHVIETCVIKICECGRKVVSGKEICADCGIKETASTEAYEQ